MRVLFETYRGIEIFEEKREFPGGKPQIKRAYCCTLGGKTISNASVAKVKAEIDEILSRKPPHG